MTLGAPVHASPTVPQIDPDAAGERRSEIESQGESAGDAQAKAEVFERGGAKLGDPVSFIWASEARLEHARSEKSVEEAERAIEDAKIAIDILRFIEASAGDETEGRWIPIKPDNVGMLVERADAVVADAEALIADIESSADEDDAGPAVAVAKDEPEKKKPRRKERDPAKPGTGLIVGGSIFTALGVGGMGLGIAGISISAIRQNEVEELSLPEEQEEYDRLDDEGKRANILGYAGLGVAVAGLAIGVPMLVVGIRKRKKAGPGKEASLQVAPLWSSQLRGLAITGRF